MHYYKYWVFTIENPVYLKYYINKEINNKKLRNSNSWPILFLYRQAHEIGVSVPHDVRNDSEELAAQHGSRIECWKHDH